MRRLTLSVIALVAVACMAGESQACGGRFFKKKGTCCGATATVAAPCSTTNQVQVASAPVTATATATATVSGGCSTGSCSSGSCSQPTRTGVLRSLFGR